MKEISIWVGNLGKYNEGELVGEWFTLPYDISDIMKTIGVAPSSEYEEWEIFDYEDHAFVKINRYSSLKNLNEIAEELAELNEEQFKILASLVDCGALNGSSGGLSCSIDSVRSGDSISIHEGETLGDIARDYALANGMVSEDHPLFNYINFDDYAEELDSCSTYVQMYGEKNRWIEYHN